MGYAFAEDRCRCRAGRTIPDVGDRLQHPDAVEVVQRRLDARVVAGAAAQIEAQVVRVRHLAFDGGFLEAHVGHRPHLLDADRAEFVEEPVAANPGGGRDSVDGGGEGATAATCGSVPSFCAIDGPATAARALPGGAVVALVAAAPARTRVQRSTPTKVIRSDDANSKPKKLNIFDSGTAQTTLPSPR